jgi:RNA polymerase sigma-70 factor (ECF subfamily)
VSADSNLGFAEIADPYRNELLAHCYRMLGSIHDAEDLVQETLLRAWRGYDQFDGRSSIRTWLYRIATNACLTALQSKHRRSLPSGLGAATEQPGTMALTHVESVPWIGPFPTADAETNDPASITALRDSTRLALIAAFQHLPARQRAVLLLVEVVGYGLLEAAEFLEVSYPAARSLLQRARATLQRLAPDHDQPTVVDPSEAEVLRHYLAAFEAADTAALAELLRADADFEMPPIALWFRGTAAILDHHERRVWTRPRRAIATSANGYPALATYTGADDGVFHLHAIQVLEVENGHIGRIVVFLDPDLGQSFRVPQVLEAA